MSETKTAAEYLLALVEEVLDRDSRLPEYMTSPFDVKAARMARALKVLVVHCSSLSGPDTWSGKLSGRALREAAAADEEGK